MPRIDPPDPAQVLSLVTQALAEDGARDDRTVAYLALETRPVRARLCANEAGVLAGIDCAKTAFDVSDRRILFDAHVSDGEVLEPGDDIADVRGPAGGILSAERVALNFLQRLSGIATLTARFVEAVRGTGVAILDTRKTTPLFRHLERYAVRVGGGRNHRFNLSDMLLVKENHIRSLGGLDRLVRWIHGEAPPLRLEVEADSLASVRALLGAPVDQIMLDNFRPADVSRAIAEIRDFQKADARFTPAIEVSGGVSLENVRDFAIDGVDCISVGALTHSAPSLDMSLEVVADDAA